MYVRTYVHTHIGTERVLQPHDADGEAELKAMSVLFPHLTKKENAPVLPPHPTAASVGGGHAEGHRNDTMVFVFAAVTWAPLCDRM